ncbi:MAG: MoaD/ThiS family protein [Bacteroidota bacterium]
MKQEIRLFGALTDVTGTNRLEIDPLPDTESLLELLLLQYPELRNYHFTLAVDNNIVSGNELLTVESTIALLPPFSGG